MTTLTVLVDALRGLGPTVADEDPEDLTSIFSLAAALRLGLDFAETLALLLSAAEMSAGDEMIVTAEDSRP